MSDAVLVSYRVADLPAPHVESVRRECADCGEDVWTDPNSLSALAEQELTFDVLCTRCLPGRLEEAAGG